MSAPAHAAPSGACPLCARGAPGTAVDEQREHRAVDGQVAHQRGGPEEPQRRVERDAGDEDAGLGQRAGDQQQPEQHLDRPGGARDERGVNLVGLGGGFAAQGGQEPDRAARDPLERRLGELAGALCVAAVEELVATALPSPLPRLVDVASAQGSGGQPDAPIELRVYPGRDGSFILYEDEGDNYNYEKGAYSTIPISWNDSTRILRIGKRAGSFTGMTKEHTFRVVWVSAGHGVGVPSTSDPDVLVHYRGTLLSIRRPRSATGFRRTRNSAHRRKTGTR